jgi:SAM-dependent methyltransferase
MSPTPSPTEVPPQTSPHPEAPTESSSRPERSEVERPLYLSLDQPPPPNFDPVARIYRFAEYLALGPLLQHTRTHFLAELPPRHQALVLGDGDGRFLTRLLEHRPHLSALVVDTSATMLQLLRHRCQPWIQRVRTLQASALTVTPLPGTDLIVTHFFLDCLTQPELLTLTQAIAANTGPGTLWLLSDFAIPPTPILKPLAALYIRFLYLAFRVLTGLRVTHLPDPQSALAAAGFTRIARHQVLHGLIYTEIWERQ